MKKKERLKPIVILIRPNLTEEQRAAQMKIIEKAAADLIIAAERAHAKAEGRPSEL